MDNQKWKMVERLARNLEETRQFMRGLDTQLIEVLDLGHATVEDCERLMDIVGVSIARFRIVERLEELDRHGGL